MPVLLTSCAHTHVICGLSQKIGVSGNVNECTAAQDIYDCVHSYMCCVDAWKYICNMLFSVIGGDLSIICWGKTLCDLLIPLHTV